MKLSLDEDDKGHHCHWYYARLFRRWVTPEGPARPVAWSLPSKSCGDVSDIVLGSDQYLGKGVEDEAPFACRDGLEGYRTRQTEPQAG